MSQRIARASALALLIGLFAVSSARAQTCDPNGFDTSPSGYDDLQEERFDSTGFPLDTAFGECHTCVASTLVLSGLVLYPDNIDAALILQEDCDAGIPLDTVFAAVFVDGIMVVPSSDETEMGFFYGSKTNDVQVEVKTSDGQSRTFNLSESSASPDCGSPGFEGFFGYCTGSDSVFIDSFRVDVSEGGIDGVRCSNCAESVPVETTSWTSVKVRF
jgi:hypothetical protein